jgi:peptidyl-prolyl cis-trans isomerase C
MRPRRKEQRSMTSPAFTLLPIAAAAALLAPGCRDRKRGPERPDGVAAVNGVTIGFEEFARELAFARRTNAGMLPRTEDEGKAFRRAALDEMIDRMLVFAAAQQAGISVPAEKVDREILRLKAEYHGANFDEALAEGQLSQQELRERTRNRLMVERYFVEEIFSRVAVTDAEVEAYFKDHADELARPEQVRAAQIIVKTPEEARRILGEIRSKGMSFDEAARRYSLSPDAKVGGDLGYFGKGMMPQVFDQACFALAPGQVSEVVASEYGFHLFKVLDKRPAEKRSLEKARAEVDRILLRKKREEAQKAAVQALRAKAHVKIDEAALAQVPL